MRIVTDDTSVRVAEAIFDEAAFVETLVAASAAVGVSLDEGQIRQCATYARMLLETNAHTNLTRITEAREMAVKHFADSLTALAPLTAALGDRAHDKTVCDVGTGAGFPGVVLKIARPDLQLVLLDSLRKRLTFLEGVCKALNLSGVRTVHARAEDAGRDPKLRDRFSVVTARAVAALPTLLEWCAPLVCRGGVFVAMKSGSMDEEIAASTGAETALQLSRTGDHALTLPPVPGSDEPPASRRVLVYYKHGFTPKEYPRSAGAIKRVPL